MRLIDADGLSLRLQDLESDSQWPIQFGYSHARRMVNGCETIDAVPVVRCKDCEYYEITSDNFRYCTSKDGGIAFFPMESDFCSYGIRKDT